MKRRYGNRAAAIITAAAAAVIFTACSAGQSEVGQERVQEFYAKASAVNAKAEVSSVNPDGDKFSFVLAYDRDSQTDAVTVEQPEQISGIRIMIKDGRPLISEDGASVDDGLDDSLKYTAAGVLPQTFKTLADDIASDICGEKVGDVSCTAFSYRESADGREYVKKIWIANDDMLPKRAEIYIDGVCAISAEFLSAQAK